MISKMRRKVLLCLVFIMVTGLLGSVGAMAAGLFDGKEITIAALAGGPNAPACGPLYYWQEEWEKMTGAKLMIAEIPWSDFHKKTMMDLMSGAGAYDGFLTHGLFYGDLLAGNYLVPIDQYYGDPKFPQWSKESVLPNLVRAHTWTSVWYGCPNDSDGHILYYRKDIFTNPLYQAQFKNKYGYDLPDPPKTWDQLLDTAEFFNGWDWDNDGKNEYGVAVGLKTGEVAAEYFLSLAASYGVFPGPVDRYHGVFYFDPETMEPIINSPAHVKALEKMLKLIECGPRAMLGWGNGPTWDAFLRGEIAMTWSWGDLGSLAQDPERSIVKGKLGCAALPGVMEGWDRQNQKWVEFDKPNAIGNIIGASWHGVISTYSKNPEVVYHLFAFHASEKVSMWNANNGWTGIDLGRTFHFLPPYGPASLKGYIDDGWDESDIKGYSEAYYKNFTQQILLNLRIPGTFTYWYSLDLQLGEAFVGKKTPKQALDAAYNSWKQITDRLGKEEQLKLFQESVGYKG